MNAGDFKRFIASRRIWLAGALALAVLAVFSPVLRADFVIWDDNLNIYENPHIRALDWPHLRWMLTDCAHARRYMPVSWLNWTLVCHFWGLHPLAFHLESLLLHSANAVLVFWVIRRLLRLAFKPEAASARLTLCSALAALLWAVNPLRVEAVAWANCEIYPQSLFFLLLALLCYLRALDRAAVLPPLRSPSYWLAVLLLTLSLLTYPTGIGFVVVLLVLDVYPLRRLNGRQKEEGRMQNAESDLTPHASLQSPPAPPLHHSAAPLLRLVLEKVPFLLATAAVAAATLWARARATGIWQPTVVLPDLGWAARLSQAFYVWAYYLWKPWLPFHLAPEYTTLGAFEPTELRFLLSGLAVVGITLAAVLCWRRAPGLGALWTCYLVLLVPMLGLTEHLHFTSDRYDYIAGLVWAVVIAAALWKISPRPAPRAAGVSLAVGLALCWGTLSVCQTRVWRDSIALFNHTLYELGNHPWSADIHRRLGWFLARQGKTDEAVRHYQTSLQIEPTAKSYVAFARLMEKNGNAEAALTNYLGLLQLSPDPVAFTKVGELLAKLGRRGEAIAFYRQTVQSFPNLSAVLNNLAWLLATDPDPQKRDGAEAIQLAERACALSQYREAMFVGTLAAAYAEAGRFEEARSTAQKAIALAEDAGQLELASKNRELLKLYEAGKPCRQ